jgi:hypothetical protein
MPKSNGICTRGALVQRRESGRPVVIAGDNPPPAGFTELTVTRDIKILHCYTPKVPFTAEPADSKSVVEGNWDVVMLTTGQRYELVPEVTATLLLELTH